MKLKISELKPNPFKKHINGGKLNEDRLAVMLESIEHGTMPEHFIARKINDKYELTSGHHRIEALRRKKGKDYVVDVSIQNYSDEQMLVDMVRENITQRDTDFHDKEAGIVLAREWLRNGVQHVNQFDKLRPQIQKGKKGFQKVDDSTRSIAKFLSKNGKAVCHETVRRFCSIHDNLSKELHEEIGKGLDFKDALSLSRIESKSEQKIIKDVLEDSGISRHDDRDKLVTTYKNLPEETKQQVLERKLPLTDIQDTEQKPMGNGEMTLKFHKRATDLIIEMRSLRKALYQFRKDKLFDNFTPKQRKGFYDRLSVVKVEYRKLIDELESSMEVLK